MPFAERNAVPDATARRVNTKFPNPRPGNGRCPTPPPANGLKFCNFFQLPLFIIELNTSKTL